MTTVLVQTGDKEPISAFIVDGAGSPLPGLSNIKIRIRRTSDGQYLDWQDNTFKPFGSVGTLLETMTEVSSAGSPGVYSLDTLTHIGGFSTSAIVNPLVAGDHYMFVMTQEGLPSSARNLPQAGEIAVGDWVDLIDQSIAANATPSEVCTELKNMRLHQLVSTNPGAVQAGAGTYVKQIIDGIADLPKYVVLQNFAFDKAANTLRGSVWVEFKNLVMASGDVVSASVDWVLADTEAVLFTVSDLVPDARGVFYIEKPAPGLVTGRAYYAKATVAITSGGNVSGVKGAFTF
jgi:hypothetical protein